MYLDDLASLLERQRALLERRTGVSLFFAVPTYLAALRSQPMLVAHIGDLRDEAWELGRAHVSEMGSADGALGEAKDRVAALGPFDRDQRLPGGYRTSMSTSEVAALYGHFHEPALLALDPADRGDLSRAGRLIRALGEHLDSAGEVRRPDPAIREIRPILEAEAVAQQARHERFIARSNGQAGVALLRLEALEHLVTKGIADTEPLRAPEPPLQIVDGAEDTIQERVRGVLYPAPGGHLEPAPPRVTQFQERIRESVELVHAELTGRIGTTRSRLGLIDRYCQRAEIYDRRRLSELASDTHAREGRLRDDLMLYLFDEGLNPLSEVFFGTVRTDIVDPSTSPGFLVEAKQYADGASVASAVRQALRQTLDTAQRLRGAYDVDEVFIVLFRRGGPHLSLPREPLVAGGRRYFFLLADIASAEVTGSRQREDPVRFDIETLEEVFAEVSAERAKQISAEQADGVDTAEQDG